MFSIAREAVPDNALLKTYRGGVHPERWGACGDCFSVSVHRAVNLADFVFAFYTSPIFRIERTILHGFLSVPSTDEQARAVATGAGTSFAVWYAGTRTATQLLMCDRYERTRSWFSVAPMAGGRTLLRFGSAVAASSAGRRAAEPMSLRFRVLLRFHVWYSQILLHSAKAVIERAHSVQA
jgi:hypothetical protein